MFTLIKCLITDNTPVDAIIDAGASMGIRVDRDKFFFSKSYQTQVIERINSTEPHETQRDVSKNNIRLVAQFVNPFTTQWNLKKLSIAYSQTINYLENGVREKCIVGYPTMDDPKLISPAVVVSVLINTGYPVNRTMTIKELQKLINFSLLSKERQMEILVTRLLMSDTKFTASSLVTIKDRKCESIDALKVQNHIISGTAETALFPTTDEMAVAMAAMKYRVNISMSKHPCVELMSLSNGTFPKSKFLRKIYNINPRAFSITYYFSDVFPVEAYKYQDLENLAKRNGIKYPKSDNPLKADDLYNLLVTKLRSRGFYRSAVSSIKSLKSEIFMTDLTGKQTPVVSYGLETDFKLFTVKELIKTFEYYMSFRLGQDEYISIVAVDDLKRIAQEYISIKSINNKDKTKWKKLLSMINLIYDEHTKIDIYKERFVLDHKGREDDAGRILLALFHLSLHMRGWDGESKWPIKDEDIPRFTDVEYEMKKQKSVKRTFRQMEYVRRIMTNDIANLPLVRYYNGIYEMSRDVQQGATIGERLKIVNDDLILNACIGMSSNWFLHTSFFYLEAIDMEPDINIEDVSNTTETVRRVINQQ